MAYNNGIHYEDVKKETICEINKIPYLSWIYDCPQSVRRSPCMDTKRYQFDLFSKMAYNNGIHYEDVKKETTIVHFAGMKPQKEYVAFSGEMNNYHGDAAFAGRFMETLHGNEVGAVISYDYFPPDCCSFPLKMQRIPFEAALPLHTT